jgi:hypothetical protein
MGFSKRVFRGVISCLREGFGGADLADVQMRSFEYFYNPSCNLLHGMPFCCLTA